MMAVQRGPVWAQTQGKCCSAVREVAGAASALHGPVPRLGVPRGCLSLAAT